MAAPLIAMPRSPRMMRLAIFSAARVAARSGSLTPETMMEPGANVTAIGRPALDPALGGRIATPVPSARSQDASFAGITISPAWRMASPPRVFHAPLPARPGGCGRSGECRPRSARRRTTVLGCRDAMNSSTVLSPMIAPKRSVSCVVQDGFEPERVSGVRLQRLGHAGRDAVDRALRRDLDGADLRLFPLVDERQIMRAVQIAPCLIACAAAFSPVLMSFRIPSTWSRAASAMSWLSSRSSLMRSEIALRLLLQILRRRGPRLARGEGLDALHRGDHRGEERLILRARAREDALGGVEQILRRPSAHRPPPPASAPRGIGRGAGRNSAWASLS